MNKKIVITLSVLFVSMVSWANVSIFGRVTDTNGETLLGVSIQVKGTGIGTVSDAVGEFVLEAPSAKSVLVFSYVGYQTTEVTVGKQTQLTVCLKEVTQDLDEVVVVGYGVQKKSHLTGSVSKFNDETVSNLAYSRADQALQGKIAGLQVLNTSSEAGAAPQIRVRGMGSLSAGNEPLVVIDGYPTADGLSFVDMNDVESIEVLKDAASAAIYGSRGANGVIIITTKSGSVTKPKYTVKAYTGFKQAYQLHDLYDAHDYVRLLQSEKEQGGGGPNTAEQTWLCIDNHTDWQREALRNVANITNAQLSVSGGKNGVRYYVSGNYTRDEGIMVHSQYDKFNIRAKMDAQLGDHVKFGINLAPSYTKREAPATNFIDFYRTYSWLPVHHTKATSELTGMAEGTWAHGRHFNNLDYTLEDGSVVTASPWGTNNNNPACVIENESRFTRDLRMSTNAYLEIEFCKGLTFRTSDGFLVSYRDYNQYHNRNAKADGDPNYALYTNRLIMDLLSENTLTYTGSWGKHDLSAMVGYTANIVKTNTAGIRGTDFPSDYIHTINAAGNITQVDADGVLRTYTLAEQAVLHSVLGRINYAYDNRYLFSLAVRADGSSKFGPQKQWGWFPSVSLGWRMSEENWLKDQSWLNLLKIRASWGVTGNNDIANYAAYDKLSSANYTFGVGNNLVSGLANTSSVLGNKAISWEQTNEFDVGFDFSVVKSRINLTFDWYYSQTKALLFQQPTMALTGYSSYWNNIGKVRNTGVEVEINTLNIKRKHFEWKTNLNLATNDNQLLELGEGQDRLLSFGERQEVYAAIVGGPSIQYYGYKTDGVWKSQEEIDAFLNGRNAGDVFLVGKTVRPGTLKVVDIDGNGIIDSYDRTALGNPFPTLTWGMTNSFAFYGVDISFLLQGVVGAHVLNGDGYYNETKIINKKYVANRYVSEAYPGDGKTPTFITVDPNGKVTHGDGMAWELTDYLIEDASYAAIKDVTIGYTFNKKQLRALKMQSLHLYLSGQNLFYIWNKGYRGINPEARYTSGVYSSPLISGYQRGGFPMQRTFSIGLELNF